MATLEMCVRCDTPTGRAGAADDSLFLDHDTDEFPEGGGPFCEECYGELTDGE